MVQLLSGKAGFSIQLCYSALLWSIILTDNYLAGIGGSLGKNRFAAFSKLITVLEQHLPWCYAVPHRADQKTKLTTDALILKNSRAPGFLIPADCLMGTIIT
jgi:hypothetical protein